ncbi:MULTISPECIES: DUF6081 family protein [unclassified Sphingomonas]|uniref:DUF6081 family protein n=1 Tax=unclassified Sphingomonas TaxID=196159 RepID=UPI000701833F|nr:MULTISPECIES: DUF6081 family protein [unclassified Sphingomonas]KQX19639.1 hypothetical protein ASD17_14150 [Sphingomonas sp. Root1294]KQY65840.1 hypothetical protein ASD39_17350 [Sphingomonas sp. Root50]KRB94853.1 hypothetical protein ASE22_02705 [Sphingomonas sp. Root720]
MTAGKRRAGTDLLWFDDFAAGIDIGGNDAAWKQLEAGEFRPDDAIFTSDGDGLTIVPKGVHPVSGEPAFTQTRAPAPPEAEIPGVLDHVKWFASVDRRSAGGVPGFDTPAGRSLQVEALMSGCTYGTEGHPFGDAVADPLNDFRLGAPALFNLDQESNVVFGFFLTNKGIFAVYERAPFARATFGDYAAFSFGMQVAARAPDDWHRLAIAYDYDANTARWLVDGKLVLEVDRVGRRLDRRHMAIDVGGEEQEVRLNQLECGLGLYTLMDGSLDGGPGLVDLYGYPMFFDTKRGAPHPQDYVDPDSLQNSRLFGQGAALRIRSHSVSYL